MRALELIGREVDKGKYAALLEQVGRAGLLPTGGEREAGQQLGRRGAAPV